MYILKSSLAVVILIYTGFVMTDVMSRPPALSCGAYRSDECVTYERARGVSPSSLFLLPRIF
jgi:hypothetical protein